MSVFRRGNTWWYEFQFNGSRIRESAKTTSKTIARQVELRRRRELEMGINRIAQPKQMPLFKVAAERLLEEKRARRARNTGELYRFALKPVVAEFGGRLVCDIAPEDIAAYQAKRLQEGKAPRTINLEVGALRVVLKAHRLWGTIADGVEMLRERKDVGRAVSREDEQKLLSAIRQSRSPALLPLFVLTIDTGLRAAEVRGLRHRDLNLFWRDGIIESGMLVVPKSKTQAGTGRTVPLSRRVCATLSLWLSRFPHADQDSYVFPRHCVGLLGSKRTPHFHSIDLDRPMGEWKKAWKVALRNAGKVGCQNSDELKKAQPLKYRWHDLRHTFISRLAENPAVSEQTIMALAGHVSRAMLARYSHIRTTAKQAATAALEESGLLVGEQRNSTPTGTVSLN